MSRDGTDPVALDHARGALGGGEEPDGTELLGQIVDNRYRLETVLGRGGMGLVYKAAHMGLRRQVAVKILHPSLAASTDVRSRFEREALAVGKIDHPNCVAVYDVGRLGDGSLYLAMELLEGKSLADVLEQEGQLAPGRALHILAHILRGLGHIHTAGLIHRDIKPENIFLVRQGTDEDFAKILDFGIAKPMAGKEKDLDDGVKLTQAGMAFGTPIYMAPEQALGNPMDGRADLYAAAVMAYEMVCGQPPFYSDDKLEVMSMHTAKPVPPMRQRVVKGGRPPPSSIERLIAKGLTKKPSERYRDADVFLAAVEEALQTADGGVTDVQFDRVDTTGSSPLVVEGGAILRSGEERTEAIADAISEALSTPAAGVAVARTQSPPRGLPPGVAQGQRVSAPPGGGVGLGLPYTGPQGEPIFGLTPAQRLAQADPDKSIAGVLEPEPARRRQSKKKWLIYGGIASVAIAAGVVIAVMTTRGGDGDVALSAVAQQAHEALEERGDPKRALAILEQNKSAVEGDANAQLILGHARFALSEYEPALDAYIRALQLQPTLGERPRLRAALRTMSAAKDPLIITSAFDLWIRTGDPQAKQAIQLAAVSETRDRRSAVVPVVEAHELVDSIEWWVAYSYDLEQGATCEERKPAVPKLRALGDKRAIEALERALERRGKHGATKNRPINSCLAEEAKAAIGYLKSLPDTR
ncbi:MAG TPA: protein kinase [Kofleriaceae bacterium]|nr:protein kinase [Kofleriaceae bacterium]